MILCPRLIIQAPHESEISPFFIPLSIDLALHATPALSILADFFLFESKYQPEDVQVGAPITAAAFTLWYGVWVEHCGKMNGVCK